MNKLITIYVTDYYVSKKVFPKKRTPTRTVSSYEIELYATAGNTTSINGEQYIQEVNNIVISRPGDVRYSIDGFECYYIHFACEAEDVINAINHMPRVFKPNHPEAVLSAFNDLISAYATRQAGIDLVAQAKTLELISLLKQECIETPFEKYEKYSQNISDACDFFAEHFDEKITLADVANAANLSPSFFHSVFKLAKGKTPSEYLLQVRLSMAKNLLRNTAKSLSEIAVLCGFESQSYFNYVFKKTTNMTPKGYRDKKRIII